MVDLRISNDEASTIVGCLKCLEDAVRQRASELEESIRPRLLRDADRMRRARLEICRQRRAPRLPATPGATV